MLVVWLAIAAILMARRGHDPYGWTALGALWGPLVVPVAIGVDGSPSSKAGALLARQLLGDRVGLLTLAMFVDYDSADSERHNITAATDHAHRALERTADLVGGDAQTVVLTGRPAETLSNRDAARSVSSHPHRRTWAPRTNTRGQ